MEIVKFKDGTYGIRRTTGFWLFKSYEYLYRTLNIAEGHDKNEWRTDPSKRHTSFYDYKKAKHVFDIVSPEQYKPKDYGTPVGD